MSKNERDARISLQLKVSELLQLVRVINIGKSTDEFKFIFPEVSGSVWTQYVHKQNKASELDLQAAYQEITYHASGTVMHKITTTQGGSTPVYRNPHGKGFVHMPISKIASWRLFMRYRIHRYECLPAEMHDDSLQILGSSALRDRRPLNFMFFLGPKSEVYFEAFPESSFLALRITHLSNAMDILIVGKPDMHPGDTLPLDGGRVVPVVVNSIEVVQLPR